MLSEEMKILLIKFFFPTPTKADSSVYFYKTPTVISNINNDIALCVGDSFGNTIIYSMVL